MPFLLPAIPALIGWGVSKLAGSSSGSNNQKQGSNLLNSAAQTGIADSNQARSTGMGLLNQFSNTLAAPTNYFQSILSGSPTSTTAALAPDINRIGGQEQNAVQSTSTLAPRGAGRSGTLFNLPFQTTSQVSGLYNGLRPQAAQGLEQIGGLQGGVGASVFGSGANYLNAGTGAASAFSGQANHLYDQSADAGSALGSALGPLFKGLNIPGFGAPGGSGSSSGGSGGGGADLNILGT